MILKFFSARTRKSHAPSTPVPAGAPAEERLSSVLKIIHAGGKVECYYMAIPAARIMEKYPLFTLARPDVFRQPWESVVRPEEILVPGQKFFVVPNRTVRKLKRRISKPIIGENSMMNCSFVSELSAADVSTDDVVLHKNEGFSSNSFAKKCCTTCTCRGTKAKGKTNKARVRFTGVDKHDGGGPGSLEKKRSTNNGAKDNTSKTARPSERKRRVRSLVTWQPSLTVIDERLGSD